MPDSFNYRVVIERVKDGGSLSAQRAKLLEKFPPFSLDNLPIDFIRRCVMDPREDYPGCIVLRYQDGTIPHKTPDAINAKTYPTYRNMQGKKISAMGMHDGGVQEGTVVRQICGNIYCVNQQHLQVTGSVVKTGRKAAVEQTLEG